LLTANLKISSHDKVSNTYTTVEGKIFENDQLKDEIADGNFKIGINKRSDLMRLKVV
jgi:hypothetical protein